jgi:hypothetical protein
MDVTATIAEEIAYSCFPVVSEPASDGDWRSRISGWPDALREDWEERSAIMEYEAGLDREAAERGAFECVASRHSGVGRGRSDRTAEPVDVWDEVEGWLLYHGCVQVDPAELDAYYQVPVKDLV